MRRPRAPRVAGRHLAGAALLAALATSCATLGPGAGTPVPAPTGAPAPRGREAAVARPEPLRIVGEPRFDVGMALDLESVTLDPVKGAELVRLDARGGRLRARVGAGALVVRVESGGSGASWRSGSTHGTLDSGDTLFVGGDGARLPSDPFRVRWNGKTWRGPFKLFLNPRGRLTVAVRLPLETYLLGVVPGEIGALRPDLLEAGRAQAIAARSYTLFYRGRRAAEGFDLFGTVEDQVYGPEESERPLATRCVESTSGRVALSEGQPIRANYCSTCGGITAEVWEAWPAASLPYLVSQRDRGSGDWCASSPQYRWREQWSAAELASNLGRYAPAQGVALPAGGVGEIVDVTIASRSRSGRVWRLRVATTTGDIEIPAYAIRQVLRRAGNPAAILRSNLFKLDVRRDPATRRALAVVASGAGSGHGVGLCQTGSLGMARAGASAESILAHYYAGIEIRRLY